MEAQQVSSHHNHVRTVPEPAPSAEASPPASEWSKVRKLALRHLNRLMSLEAKVLKGTDPDAIHDMRVASRRLQQVLDLVFPQPPPREGRRLRRKLRQCRRALGDVRNCDVLLQYVDGRLAKGRDSDREAWLAVKQHLEERRSDGYARAIRKLGKLNLAVFYMRTRAVLDRLKPAPESEPVSHALVQPNGLALDPFAQRLAQALVNVWSEFDTQVEASHRENTTASIHGARIRAKRLRYLLEVVNQFGIAGSSNALTWLKKIQQYLGDWHDREVLEEMIIEMIAKPEFWRDQLTVALAAGKLILRDRAAKQGFRDKYFQMTLRPSNHKEIKNWAQDLLGVPAAAHN